MEDLQIIGRRPVRESVAGRYAQREKINTDKAYNAKGQVITPENEKKLLDEIKGRYEKQTSPYYAAARLWVDDIIDPVDTRKVISEGIAAANHNANINELKTGVFQV